MMTNTDEMDYRLETIPMNRRKQGFTLIELLVVMSIIALLLSILVPALGRARAQAMLVKDASQINGIFKGWTSWAGDHDGYFPIPGLEKRQQDTQLGQYIKGRGPEDLQWNDHGSLLSLCIMQNLYTPDTLMAPTEPNGNVGAMTTYNFEVYEPPNGSNEGVLWDEEFSNELQIGGSGICNNSYGIIPVTGERRVDHWGWHKINDSSFAVVGTRGPADGDIAANPDSLSTQFHGIDGEWKGIVCFGDNHTEILGTFYPQNANYISNSSGLSIPDNLFEEEADALAANPANGTGDGTGHDIVLTHIAYGDINVTDGRFGGITQFRHD